MNKHTDSCRTLCRALLLTLVFGPGIASATPILGSTLETFAVLAASTVTNIPTSTVVGSVGVCPGSAITGFNSLPGVAVSDPQVTSGTVQATTAVACQGQNELTIARLDLSLLGPGTLLSSDLVGLTIFPGVYTVPAGTTNLSGTVTLDGQGNANAAWVFQFPSTLITSPNSVVNVINTGAGAGLFWNVGSSATLDTTTSFQGNILALTAITLNTFATIGCGRALADNAAVTMDMNVIGFGCNGSTGGEGTNGYNGGLTVPTGTVPELPTVLPYSPVGGVAVSEPSTALLLLMGTIGMLGARKYRRRTARLQGVLA